jgi:hypothetical protein
MTGILSSLSSHFGKALMLGAFLPSTIFVILWSIFIEPIFPAIQTFLKPLGIYSQEWLVLAALFIIVVLTGMLHNLNIPIIRFYEGYPWQYSRLGKRKAKAYQAKYEQAQARQHGIRTLLRAMKSSDPDYSKVTRYWSRSGDVFRRAYPNRDLLILPTRFGNVIRSFERYPDEQYKIESILFWTRLVSKIDKEYAVVIADSKTSVDFMVNSSLINGVLAFSALVLGLIYPQNTLGSPSLCVAWFAKLLGFSVLAYLFYLGAISRASAWGETVKAAFDLYRWDLLKQMGYQQLPKTRKAERALWNNISVQLTYGDHPDRGPLLDYSDPSAQKLPSALSATPGLSLTLSRGVSRTADERTLQVVLEVQNPDRQSVASQVVVTDQVPAGYEYVWASAVSCGHTLSVEGANPYTFSIGDLPPEGAAQIRYTILCCQADPG